MIYAEIQSPVGPLLIAGNEEDNSVMAGMVATRKYEPHVQALLRSVIKDDFACLDAGANYGQHTVLMSKLGKYVWAIEASKSNCKNLQETINVNGCNNVTVVNQALWSEKTVLTFSHAETNAACSYLSTEGHHQVNEQLEQLETDTLDNLFPSLFCGDIVESKAFDFIKMDIEGSELFALQGGNRIFTDNKRLLIELNAFTSQNFMGVPIEDVIDKIVEYGYNTQYVFSPNSGPGVGWNPISIEALKAAFSNGAILIDVYFTKE